MVLVAAVLLTACGGRNPQVDRSLLEADRIMNESPAEALALLDSVKTPIPNEDQRAHHALLYTKALRKNHFALVTDTLIRIASEYYQGRGDSLEVQALYYNGEALSDMEDYANALVLLTESYIKATAIDDRFYAAMSARGLTHVYHVIMQYNKARDWALVSKDIFLEIGKPLHAASTEVYYCEAVAREGKLEEALRVADSLLNIYGDSEPYLKSDMLRVRYDVLSRQKKYEEAEKALREIETTGYQILTSEWNRLSVNYMKQELFDKAREIHEIARPMLKTLLDTLYFEFIDYRLVANSGRIEEAYDMADTWALKILADNDQRLMHHPSASLTDYLNQKIEQQNEISAARNRILWLSVALCAILLSLVVSLLVIFKQKRKIAAAERLTLIESLDRLRKELVLEKDEGKNLIDERNLIFKDHICVLNTICEEWYVHSARLINDDKLYKGAVSFLNDIRDSKASERLEDIVNRNNDNWMSRFRSAFPGLKEYQYKYVLYQYLGFSTSAMAIVLDKKNTRQVHMIKHQLKERLRAMLTEDNRNFMSRLGFNDLSL